MIMERPIVYVFSYNDHFIFLLAEPDERDKIRVTQLAEQPHFILELMNSHPRFWVEAFDSNSQSTIIDKAFIYIAEISLGNLEVLMEVLRGSFDLP
ncbi:hypothetical protein SLA2020_124560 [Shorea laevis]